MSELMKRADLFNVVGTKPLVDAKLVSELVDRIRYLESPTLRKRIAVGFFQYWWNSPGTNTNQGFDEYYQKLLMNELELPSEGAVAAVVAVEEITEADIHETKFPPDEGRIPIDRGRDADRRYHMMQRDPDRRNDMQKRLMPLPYSSDEEG
jgi:hypothetical protein